MDVLTHKKINRGLCGTPIELRQGFSKVTLQTEDVMSADEFDLVHGGFIFGLADYSAMLAVNHPNVVLGSAEVAFEKPVKVGETLVAEAQRIETNGHKNIVKVAVKRGEEFVFQGIFTCLSLKKHVLDPN